MVQMSGDGRQPDSGRKMAGVGFGVFAGVLTFVAAGAVLQLVGQLVIGGVGGKEWLLEPESAPGWVDAVMAVALVLALVVSVQVGRRARRAAARHGDPFTVVGGRRLSGLYGGGPYLLALVIVVLSACAFMVAVLVFDAPPKSTGVVVGAVAVIAGVGTSLHMGVRARAEPMTGKELLAAVLSVGMSLGMMGLGVVIWFRTGNVGLAITPYFGFLGLAIVWAIVWGVHKTRRDARTPPDR
jgi:hypothetical protein